MLARFAVMALAIVGVGVGTLLAGDRSRVIDGNTIAIGRQHVRIWGIDAPDWPEDMKQAASDFLARQIEREGGIECATAPAEIQAVRRSRAPSCVSALTSYERIVAACRFKRSGADVAERMARAGYAVDWRRYSAGYYAAAADQARADRAGLWRSRSFQMEDLTQRRDTACRGRE